MRAYMRNQFDFLGLDSSLRRRLARPFSKALPPDELQAAIARLWELPEREFQYCAMELAEKSRKLWVPEQLALWRWMIEQKSWWDTVDFLASHLVGEHLRRFGGDLDSWVETENVWLQRTAILYQLNYGHSVDKERLFRTIDRLADSSEFFIRKAIGWALRQLARHFPQEVRQYVGSRPNLSGLSRREALKHLQKEQK